MLRLGTQAFLKTLFSNLVKFPIANFITTEHLVSPNSQFVRNASFFNKLTQKQLWKGVTSVSNAGKRKGRRGELKGRRNLNEGRPLGVGKLGISWPGLNSPVLKGKEISKISKLSQAEKPEISSSVIMTKKRSKVHPLERGWSGKRIKGRKIGPPDKTEDNEAFHNFESVVLEHRSRSSMTSILGRRRKFFSIVATGNSNGVIGLGASTNQNSGPSIQLAKKKASKRLLTIDLIDSHTVNHDFFSEYGKTKVFVYKRSKGHGLVCHRVIKVLCQLIGIENLSAKVEGPCNVINIIRAFITGLRKQKTYQEIADEKNLHLVEFREESFNFPRLLASPQKCLSLAEARKNPISFEEYIMSNKLVLRTGPKVPFYMKLPSWQTHLKRTLYHRNHQKVKIELLTKYDSYKSHLSEVYPECVAVASPKQASSDQ